MFLFPETGESLYRSLMRRRFRSGPDTSAYYFFAWFIAAMAVAWLAGFLWAIRRKPVQDARIDAHLQAQLKAQQKSLSIAPD
jgi:hypothetical protein